MRRLTATFRLICSILLIHLLCPMPVAAQHRLLTGKVVDGQNDEPVPFASLRLRQSRQGVMADSSGFFRLRLPALATDTLEVSSVGYRDYFLPLDASRFSGDSLYLSIRMEPGKYTMEVVVRKKVNRGLLLWKRIVARKPMNDRYRFRNFSYELYNKLELDLKNVSRDKLSGAKLLRKLDFIFDYIDSSDGVTTLPAYLTEAISHYYFQKEPVRRREVFKGVKTLGVENASISRLMGGMDQNVNFYNNFIPVFDKEFVSPISDKGDAYYNYKVADTQYVGGRRFIHLLFAPKRAGANTFEGDCWVHDSTYAIQKMSLRLGKEANINYVDKLSLVQEYRLINDSTWFLLKDKFVVDISLIGKTNISFIGRKTTTYRDVVVNDVSVTAELEKNRKQEEVILPQDAGVKDETYWSDARHEELSSTEQSIYEMIDTLLRAPAFVRYTRTLNFIGTGYGRVGNYLIGPWQNWISSNFVEGLRLRFDLGTNSDFHKDAIFHGYLAYGFGDKKWKGEIDGMYLFNRQPRSYVYASYVNDFDYGQNYFDEISTDNIFALAIRKNDVPIKFIRLREERLDLFQEWSSGFSLLLSGRHKQYDPVRNLPDEALFPPADGNLFNSFEASLRLRFAYLEKFIENNFYRSSLGSPYPIVELKYSKGLSGVLKSRWDYHKLSASVSNYQKIPPFGSLYFNLFAGKTFGTLPYMFLDVAPGNEIYYYNRYAFNLMNRYEYIHDRFAGLNIEHTIGNGLFRFLPLTRKLKLRQLWTAKVLWGDLRPENRQLNFSTSHYFNDLNGRTYMEIGTGIDNILKVLRVDFIWKVLPQSHAKSNAQRFGVFGSFRFAF